MLIELFWRVSKNSDLIFNFYIKGVKWGKYKLIKFFRELYI